MQEPTEKHEIARNNTHTPKIPQKPVAHTPKTTQSLSPNFFETHSAGDLRGAAAAESGAAAKKLGAGASMREISIGTFPVGGAKKGPQKKGFSHKETPRSMGSSLLGISPTKGSHLNMGRVLGSLLATGGHGCPRVWLRLRRGSESRQALGVPLFAVEVTRPGRRLQAIELADS